MTREKNAVSFYGAIEKFDAAADGSLMVSGIASTEAVDADGEIITADAMREAIKGYMELTPLGFPKGTIREMHGAKAVGCPVSVSVDEKGNTRLTAHIVDKSAVEKITAGVLKGFSLAGKTLKKTGNKINSLLLKDFSLVDIPNNPQTYFTVLKFDPISDEPKTETEKIMSAELIKTVGDLTKMVETLSEKFETFSKAAPAVPAELAKVLTDIGDLKKFQETAVAAVENAERTTVITKMQIEGRVAFNENGVAFKTDELQKMDLTLLKFASRNSQVIPLVARATYTGSGAPPEEFAFKDASGKDLSGDAIIEKAWGGKYASLAKMTANLN